MASTLTSSAGGDNRTLRCSGDDADDDDNTNGMTRVDVVLAAFAPPPSTIGIIAGSSSGISAGIGDPRLLRDAAAALSLCDGGGGGGGCDDRCRMCVGDRRGEGELLGNGECAAR